MSSPEPHAAPHNTHGNSPAAWTAVVIILVAFVIGTWAVINLAWPVFWASVGLLVAGVVVGRVMVMLGFGNSAVHHQPADPASDAERSAEPVRDPSVVNAERAAHLMTGEPVPRDGEPRPAEDDALGQYGTR